MDTIESGFLPGSHMGNELDPDFRAKYAAGSVAAKNTFSHRVYENSLSGIESISESQTVFPRHKPVLMGMTLDRVPTGGFSSPVSVMMGGPDESTFRINNTSYFLQPGNAVPKRTEISNGLPLTGGFPKSELVYRVPNGKKRPPHGGTTIRRAEQEVARGARRMAAARLASMGGSLPVPEPEDDGDEEEGPGPSVPIQAPPIYTQQQLAPSPPPAIVYTPRPGPAPAALEQVTVHVKLNTLPQFWAASMQALQGNYTGDEFKEYMGDNWPFILNIVLLGLVVTLMIVAIVVAARPRSVKTVPVYWGPGNQAMTTFGHRS